ncbi:hypothetical protein [Billgrantia gudaonensis]|uniref:hypothetical protein n=1 Tax=Billgrantia gudaonensis TaxID=376427 RepID=UPI001FE17B5D|nr:hypothetical protein [Halomonas gudaonensis]
MSIVTLLLWLAGCGGGEDGSATEGERVGGVAQPEADTGRSESTSDDEQPTVEPFTEPARIEVTTTLRGDRRLMVEGESNLPEGSRLQVMIERELSGVRWRSRTAVEKGRFVAGPFGPGSGLPDGGYILRVTLTEADAQPEEVRARIGEEGEHLSGPLVVTSRHGLGQVISYSKRYLIGSEPRRATDQVEVLEVE